MRRTLQEELTNRFYAWEERGRGWQDFDFSVELEPEFYPFFGHYASVPETVDDGKRHTIFSWIGSAFSSPRHRPAPAYDNVIPEVRACKQKQNHDLVSYDIALPKDCKFAIEDMRELLLMLSYTKYPVSFEIVGTGTTITTQITCRSKDMSHVSGQIRAYFPAAYLTPAKVGLELFQENVPACIYDLGLTEEFVRPLAMAGELKHDPYIGLFALLEELREDQRGIIQILFSGTRNPWSESVLRAVTDTAGGPFFEDAPYITKEAQTKVASPLFAVSIKVIGQSPKGRDAVALAKGISAALTRLTKSGRNQLQTLNTEDYNIDLMMDDCWLRESHRLGMLLNTEELATLVHFPTAEIASSKVARDTKKTKLAPEGARGHQFVLGKNSHHGNETVVSVPAHLRLKHTHIIGATGTGKSTLLLSMIAQDMQQGTGLAVLDPHGDLIETILAYVPKNRIKDVILIDPADGEYPVAFNVLSAHSEIEKDILSSDLVAAFKRLSTSWGDQMNSVLANAILVFLESTEGGTLIDLRRFLLERPFRETCLKTVKDPHVVYYWQHEYPLLKSSSIGSILTRLDTFLRPKLIRNMVAQKKGLDFEDILDTQKILLVKLSQGLIGAENSFLLGTFFVSKMYQAAMARQAKSKDDRNDFFLYIDEFQNFITPSMSHILSGARKYHLGLILAHQDMQQLQKYDSELASSVIVNAGTRICFRLGDTDAKRFASGFSYFDAADLENLHTGEAIARIEQPNFDFSLSTIPLPEVSAEVVETISQAVITTSRLKYGTPRETVEKDLDYVQKDAKEPIQEAAPISAVKEPTPVIQTEPLSTPAPFVPVEILKKEDAPAKKAQTQHRYLQALIKRMAESRGFKATLEELTPDGKGRVDVSLEREGRKIAVEISVTTTDVWEAHNVEKCLTAGYEEVIVCSSDPKHLQRIKTQLESKLSVEQLAKVKTLEPQEAIQFFDVQIAQETTTEKVIKGYRVKVEYNTSTSDEMGKKQGKVIKAVTDSIRKKKP